MLSQLALMRNLGARGVPTVKQQLRVVHLKEPPEWPMVFQQFEGAVRAAVGAEAERFCPKFSTTGLVQQAAYSVALMDAYASSFLYVCCSACGIPSVVLLGTGADWELAERIVGELAEEMRGFVCAKWAKEVQRTMATICASYFDPLAHAHIKFWQSVFRWHSESGREAVTGWISVFFPIVKKGDQSVLYWHKAERDYARQGLGSINQFVSKLLVLCQ